MSFDASWLIGSVEDWPAYTIQVDDNGGGFNNQTLGNAGDGVYLRDVTDDLSILAQLEEAMTAEGVTNPAVFLRADRKVGVTADTSFRLSITDSDLQDYFGGSGPGTLTTSYTFPNVSTLLWSPGWPETADTPPSFDGHTIRDTVVTSSPTGLTASFTHHHESTIQRFGWDAVDISRVWSNGDGGEYRRFFDDVLRAGLRWKLIRNVAEVTSGATNTAAALLGGTRGPYKLRAPISHEWYRRGIANADTHSPVTLLATKVSEYP